MGCFKHDDYISVTMEFRCNLKCVHCMIEGTMDVLQPQSNQVFEEVLAEQARHQRWQGLILTGSEITLHKQLIPMVQAAKAAGFKHVRIQTHGMHLGQSSFCDDLLEAGVDEYFVSVAGCDARTHDDITQVDGSFDKMMEGLRYLDQFDHVTLITNTVVTQLSYALLPELVTSLAHLQRLRQMEFWHYWPMTELDDKKLIPRVADVLPALEVAITRAQALGRVVEIKNFPECLLGNKGHLLDNDQPQLLIDPAFWDQFNRNGFHQCVYREECTSLQCLGLNDAYTAKYGWEQTLLSPVRDGALIARSSGNSSV
ncbi:radical SAM protein [Gammaproteobacteria bacterium 50_400_T64]|nr:radical SAM protein [Gammaproteobacteria bacterium 50_400_T64]